MIEMRSLFLGHGFSGVAPGSISTLGLKPGLSFDCRVDAWQDPPVASLSCPKPELRPSLIKLLNSWNPAG